jgi:hypothetical protein
MRLFFTWSIAAANLLAFIAPSTAEVASIPSHSK